MQLPVFTAGGCIIFTHQMVMAYYFFSLGSQFIECFLPKPQTASPKWACIIYESYSILEGRNESRTVI